MVEFYNSDLGEPFSPPGGGLTIAELDACRADYSLDRYADQPTVMGVDVGMHSHHVAIREAPSRPSAANNGGRLATPGFAARLWFAGAISKFSDGELLRNRFNTQSTVIDIQPETHMVS